MVNLLLVSFIHYLLIPYALPFPLYWLLACLCLFAYVPVSFWMTSALASEAVGIQNALSLKEKY